MDWSLQVRRIAGVGQTGLILAWDLYKKIREICSTISDMFVNLQFFSMPVACLSYFTEFSV